MRFQWFRLYCYGLVCGGLLGAWGSASARAFFAATNGTDRQRVIAWALLLVGLALSRTPPPKPSLRRIGWVLILLGPNLGLVYNTLPIDQWGLGALFGLTLVVTGRSLGGISFGPTGATLVGAALGVGLADIWPGPWISSQGLGTAAGLLLCLISYKQIRSVPDSNLATAPLLLTLVGVITGLALWGTHRPWLAFLTPTRGSEALLFIGILLSCALLSPLLKRFATPAFWLLVSAIGLGGSLWFFQELPSFLGLSGFLDVPNWALLQGSQLLLAMGIALLAFVPLSTAALQLSKGVAFAELPRVLPLGVAAGLCLATLLLPIIETDRLLLVAAALSILSGLAESFLRSRRAKLQHWALAVLGITLLATSPSLDPKLLSGAVYPQLLQKEGVRRTLTEAGSRTLLFFFEDSEGGTAVFSAQPYPSLIVGGAPVESGAFAADDNRFAAYLPALLHGDAQTASVLGPGTGIGLDALRRLGIDVVAVSNNNSRLDALAFLEPLNRHALSDPGVHRAGYGIRAHLKANKSSYDLVIMPGLPLWTLEGSLALSQQAFEMAHKSLRENGLLSLTIPLEALGPEDLNSIVKTMLSVFPSTTAWLPPSGSHHLVLLGHKGPVLLPYMSLLTRLGSPKLREDLGPMQILKPEDLLSHLLAGPEALAAISEGSGIIKDSRPALDISLASATFRESQQHPLSNWRSHLADLSHLVGDLEEGPSLDQLKLELTRAQESHMAFLALLSDLGRGEYDQAVDAVLRMGPKNDREIATLVRPYLERAKQDMNIGLLEEAQTQLGFAAVLSPRDPEPLLLSAQVHRKGGDNAAATAAYRKALDRDPDNLMALLALAELVQQDGLFTEAIGFLEQALQNHPTEAVISHNLGELYRIQGNLKQAELRFQHATMLDRSLASSHAGLAQVRLESGSPETALASANTAVRLDASALHFEILGTTLLALRDQTRARSALVQCLLRDPDSINCLGSMGIVYARENQLDKAQANWEKILELQPNNKAAAQNLERLNNRGNSITLPLGAPTRP